MKVLMLASFGLEIVECAGALAKALAAGDEVHAAVLLSRKSSRPQISEAAKIIGIEDVTYLGAAIGEIEVTPTAKVPIVRLLRTVRPEVVIMQDPEHAQHDLDPDRRMIALLYAESLAIASRDWRIDECGGGDPLQVPTIFYMTPERPNCVVEISDVLGVKQQALDVLAQQNSFSAQHWRAQAADTTLQKVAPGWTPGDTDEELGRLGERQIFLSLAVASGLGSHSGAVLGEPYRREGTFLLDRLSK
ncbi:PIG-L deacetylase family protein [Amycolatopsis palatopharyngis]|uniref:PIG-L deacetylase family protein n=1 Tax=Amycolatopsis palatopharyngis TaxID=187982 RepID=UPI000E2373BE|nr:GlcNAc-PI de-N-acetylase [Amycolatopsis palatopharyngis]